MSRIVVIGAKGMLGRDLMTVLSASSKDEIMGWDLEEIDITHERETLDRIEQARPEIVINVAAYTNVDGCESEIDRAFAVNAEGMRHVALGARACGAKVVYLSTDYVFDGEKGQPYLETDSPHPLNVYGRSKWMGERYVQELTDEALIIRTQWLFGKHGHNFVTSILRQAQEKQELAIVDDQIGSPTYTFDLANTIGGLLQRKAKGIFHVVNSGFCSWYSFGRMILDISGRKDVRVKPITSKELNRPAIRPGYSVLGCEKLKREAGMTLRPWLEALKDFLQSLQEG